AARALPAHRAADRRLRDARRGPRGRRAGARSDRRGAAPRARPALRGRRAGGGVGGSWTVGAGLRPRRQLGLPAHARRRRTGPQAVFFADPRVLTIALHQDGRTLFPGTGGVDEVGEGDARGTAVNVPLPPETGDDDWRRAFEEVVPPLVEAFRPEVLVTQLGCDSHVTDPLANLALTTTAYKGAAVALHDLAHRVCGGRWVASGGGGYEWAQVVPRAWTTYFAE